MAAASNPNEIRLTRVYDAPLRAVWDAWTIPEQIALWWGPRGFTLTTHSRDLRTGGGWRYTMHGPDGTDYPNVTRYLEVEPFRKLVYDHGATDDRPPLFRVTVTFTEQAGKTTMDMTSTLPSPEAAVEMTAFIRKAGGNATWDRLAEHLAETATGTRTFVINRTFDAPIARVFAMWTSADDLARWLPPAGTRMHFTRSEIAAGRSTLATMTGEHGAAHVRTEYLEITKPARIVYTQQFVDEREQAVRPPWSDTWPLTLRNTVVFTEEAPERTRVTVTTEAHGEASPADVDAFANERPGMTRGWTGAFDELEGQLEVGMGVGAGSVR